MVVEGRNVITPAQAAILSAFAQAPDSGRFYLTGGTALSEFYYGHRKSYDLDFFTTLQGLVLPFSHAVEDVLARQGITAKPTRRLHSFAEFLCTVEGRPDDGGTRLQLACDSPFRFADPLPTPYGVMVNDYEDLIVDKLLAFFGRWTHRDTVDLYFILQREDPRRLLAQALRKDPGFDRYWLAVALAQVETFPAQLEDWDVSMLVPLDLSHLRQAIRGLVREIMDRIYDGRP